ncbi:MAG: hypothetical protein WCI74_11710 [Actinomycetes bacterium]
MDGNLAAIHSQATTTVAGVERTSCRVCHAAGVPATRVCADCHPDKAASHYIAQRHTATLTSASMTILGTDYGDQACASCHTSAELGVIHTSGCSTCHPTPATSTKPWDGSCTAGDCHSSGSTKPMHAQLDPAHMRPAPTLADACFVSGCHTGGASLADIHAGKQGCPTCHGPGKTPSAECVSGGCHASLEVHPEAPTVHAVDMGHAVVAMGMSNADHGPDDGSDLYCGVCHAQNLETLHASNCATCHASGRSDVQAAINSGTKECSACHLTIHPSAGPSHSALYGGGHYSDCLQCHDEGIGAVNCGRCHSLSDNVRPTTTSDAVSAYAGSARVTLTPSDPYLSSGIAHTYYVLDSGTRAEGTIVDVVGPAVGSATHSLEFWSVDNAGNEELPHHAVTFTIAPETTPPTGSVVINAGANWTSSTAAVVTLSANDLGGSGLADMRISDDNLTWSLWETYATPKDWTLTAGDGTKTVYVQYRDAAGNVSAIYSDTIGVETQAPSTGNNATEGTVYTGAQNFVLTPSDAGGSGVAGTWWQLDSTSGPWVSGTSVSVDPPSSGVVARTLYWYSRDNAGNEEAYKSVSFSVSAPAADTIPPTTNASFNPATGAAYGAAQLVVLTATDNTGGSGVKTTYWRVDSGAYTPGTSFVVSGDGPHTFSYYSVDSEDNAEPPKVSNQFTIDTVAPVTTSNAVAAGVYTGAQTFSLTPVDTDGSGVATTWWQLDSTSGPWMSGTSVPVTAPSSGTAAHTLYWYSTDVAGNTESTKSVAFSVSAPATGGTTTLEFRTNGPGEYFWTWWQVLDSGGNVIWEGGSDDGGGHPENTWGTVDVPSGYAYTMLGSVNDAPLSGYAVTSSMATPGAIITNWW